MLLTGVTKDLCRSVICESGLAMARICAELLTAKMRPLESQASASARGACRLKH